MANDTPAVANDVHHPPQPMQKITLSIDLIFCLVVIPTMALIFPVERWFHHFPLYVGCVGVWIYGAYFLNRFVTVPSLFGSRRRVAAGVGILVFSLCVTLLLSRIVIYEPKPNVHDAGLLRVLPPVPHYGQAVWSLFMLVETFSLAVGLLVETERQRARRRAVEAERDRAQLSLYRARIKPHFMFNTLNTLYGLFLTRNEGALGALEKFISMMRYIHTTSGRDLVALGDEVAYIREYIDLQSLRLGPLTELDVHIDVRHPGRLVPPMLLVTFVENCFKHGVSADTSCRLVISLVEDDDTLSFTTLNSIFPAPHPGEHMGIANCRHRLELLFAGCHTLTAGPTADSKFKVELNIKFPRP